MRVDYAFIAREYAFPSDGFGVDAKWIGIREFMGPVLPMPVPASVVVFHVSLEAGDEPGEHSVHALHVLPDGQRVFGQNWKTPLEDNRPGVKRRGATLVWTWANMPLLQAGPQSIQFLDGETTIGEIPFEVSIDSKLPAVGCGY